MAAGAPATVAFSEQAAPVVPGTNTSGGGGGTINNDGTGGAGGAAGGNKLATNSGLHRVHPEAERGGTGGGG